jgi:hypothetical protein
LGALVGLLSEALERIGDGERIVVGGRVFEVARVRITEAGRRALTR